MVFFPQLPCSAGKYKAPPERISSLLARLGRGTGTAGRALDILADLDRVKAGAQRVVDQQGAVETVAEPQQLLEHLDRLQSAEDTGDGAEDAGGLAAGYQVGRRRLAKEAPVARVACAEIGPEGRDLALERGQSGRDERLS